MSFERSFLGFAGGFLPPRPVSHKRLFLSDDLRHRFAVTGLTRPAQCGSSRNGE